MNYTEYPEIGAKYQHYKGGKYEVITMSTHTETKEPLVIYKSLLFGSIYARPLKQWFELVDPNPNEGESYDTTDLKSIPRFKKIKLNNNGDVGIQLFDGWAYYGRPST